MEEINKIIEQIEEKRKRIIKDQEDILILQSELDILNRELYWKRYEEDIQKIINKCIEENTHELYVIKIDKGNEYPVEGNIYHLKEKNKYDKNNKKG